MYFKQLVEENVNYFMPEIRDSIYLEHRTAVDLRSNVNNIVYCELLTLQQGCSGWGGGETPYGPSVFIRDWYRKGTHPPLFYQTQCKKKAHSFVCLLTGSATLPRVEFIILP